VEKLIKHDEQVHATYCIIAKTLRIDGKGKHSGLECGIIITGNLTATEQ